MTTITAVKTAMFPATSGQVESMGGYLFYDKPRHPSEDVLSRPRVELPRPLEPRPSYQSESSTADQHASMSRQEGHGAQQPIALSQGHNLPAIRELLNPTPQTSKQTPHASDSTSTSSTGFQAREPFHKPPGLHPPLALQPQLNTTQAYHANQHRRDVPILDTRYPSQHAQISPYGVRSDQVLDLSDHRYYRQRQDSTVSHPSQNAPSPYTPVTADDKTYGFQYSLHNRQSSGEYLPLPPSGPETNGKYLGIRDVPGEGQFHIYESGVRIPTEVDGEQVNPAWGLTKANKPRKRLAAACLDCREKKIKCEPGINSCLQCEKARRTCRKSVASTSNYESTPSTTWSTSADSPARTHGGSDPTPSKARPSDNEPNCRRRQRDETSMVVGPSKKPRSVSPYPPSPSGSQHNFNDLTIQGRTLHPGTVRENEACWQADPCTVNREATLRLLNVYFTHINDAIYYILPYRTFMHWVHKANHESDERMTLHAMLAVASVFGAHIDKDFGEQCFTSAAEAVASKHGKFSLLIAQSRLLLSLYHFAKGNEGAAWDCCGAAIRVAHGMRLNTEEGCLDGLTAERRPQWQVFHFNNEQVAESRRRTFWSLFFLDRIIGHGCGSQCITHEEDIFLRLPSTDKGFDSGFASSAPLFNNGIIDPTRTILTAASAISPMAWLMLGVALWGNVLTFISRADYRAPDAYGPAYGDFYSETYNAISGWTSRLPEHLHYRKANLEQAAQRGYAGAFIGIHVFHHLTLMKLNRWAKHALLPDNVVPRNIRAAYDHAQQLLGVMRDVQELKREMLQSEEHEMPRNFFCSSVFSGSATLSAVDIIAAGGMDQNLKSTIALIEDGHACLRDLEQYWSSAKSQSHDVHKRLLQIRNVVQRPDKARSGCWLGRQWGIEDPMEVEFGREDDCIYGVEDSTYFAAFTDDSGRQRTRSGSVRI